MKQPHFWTLIFIALFAASLGCQEKKSGPSTTLEWSEGSSHSLPTLFSNSQFAGEQRPLLVLGEYIQTTPQRLGEALVEGGQRHMVRNKNGDVIYGRLDYVSSPEEAGTANLKEIENLHRNRAAFLVEARKRNFQIRHSQLLSEVQVRLIKVDGELAPVYSLDLIKMDKTGVERWYLKPNARVVNREPLSADFDHTGYVYDPRQMNQVQEVIFKDLLNSKFLESDTQRVKTQSPQGVNVLDGPFQFQLEDPKFYQAQTFYFVQQALNYFEFDLGFKLPVRVEVETSMGYPQKTNAAFTYNNQIRLGDGDSQIYQNIPNDPTIVIHEVSHILNSLIARLPTQGEGGSLNEAFADFFTASYLGSPFLGQYSYKQGARRNLEDVILFSEKNGSLYGDSQIVSGTLWQIRKELGADLAQKLALRTLTRLGPSQSLADFSNAIARASQDLLTDSQRQTVDAILKGRQWPAPSSSL